MSARLEDAAHLARHSTIVQEMFHHANACGHVEVARRQRQALGERQPEPGLRPRARRAERFRRKIDAVLLGRCHRCQQETLAAADLQKTPRRQPVHQAREEAQELRRAALLRPNIASGSVNAVVGVAELRRPGKAWIPRKQLRKAVDLRILMSAARAVKVLQ
jgi:hypothetical protein